MNFKKNIAVYSTMIALAVFAVLGWSIALHKGGEANAQSGSSVDGETLDALYDAVFHRPADAGGRGFHLGRDIKDILRDFRNSQENRYYGALFKAVKAYEEAQRAPGTLSAEEKQSYLDLIDSALSNLLAWVATLPDQEACRATVGPENAREAVQEAYDRLSNSGKGSAEHGLLNALRRIGPPSGIKIHPKCLRPSPSTSPTETPHDDEDEDEDEDETPTPSATPTPTPSETPTPTPSS